MRNLILSQEKENKIIMTTVNTHNSINRILFM